MVPRSNKAAYTSLCQRPSMALAKHLDVMHVGNGCARPVECCFCAWEESTYRGCKQHAPSVVFLFLFFVLFPAKS